MSEKFNIQNKPDKEVRLQRLIITIRLDKDIKDAFIEACKEARVMKSEAINRMVRFCLRDMGKIK